MIEMIVQAVQVLNSLVTLKLKVQELRAEALKVRAQVDILFTDEPLVRTRSLASKKASRFLKLLPRLICATKKLSPKQSKLVLCSTKL